jgi:hypothetical protein
MSCCRSVATAPPPAVTFAAKAPTFRFVSPRPVPVLATELPAPASVHMVGAAASPAAHTRKVGSPI